MPVIVAVHGPSGSGKTMLIERVIPHLTARGLRLGVVKHAHEGFVVDQRGKDSHRVWEAGARAVLVAAPGELFVRQRSAWSSLSELLGQLPQGLDCILIEGFAHTAGALDVPVSVSVEIAPEGVRLDGQPVRDNNAIAEVESAIVSRLQSDHGIAASPERRHE